MCEVSSSIGTNGHRLAGIEFLFRLWFPLKSSAAEYVSVRENRIIALFCESDCYSAHEHHAILLINIIYHELFLI
jgi:hypothetical protein